MDRLLHIRVGKKIKKEMQKLIDSGLFSNQSEMAREAIRDLLIKYSKHLEEKQKKKDENIK